MKILADSKIPYVLEAFADIAEVTVVDTQNITPAALHDADVLVVRSETRVDKRLLGDSTVKFVATSTIGVDHVDTDYLQERGIGFASAPGSNANSVAEYIVSALLVLAARQRRVLSGRTIGVVGVGNVGAIVVRYARALGMSVLQNDPPRARATGDPAFLPLDELMTADVVTLHVPLTKAGPDKTYHLFDEERIRRMKPGSLLINTSRGSVVGTEGIKRALCSGHLAGSVLDVWEGEPAIDPELLSLVMLGTPHIAGYSFDGKLNGVVMIHDAVCEHFGLPSAWAPQATPGKEVGGPILIAGDGTPEGALLVAIRSCYDIESDDRRLRAMLKLPPSDRPAQFRRLRAEYPVRREFSNYRVVIPDSRSSLAGVFQTLGFKTMLSGTS